MEAAARTELIETRANPTDEGAAPSSEAEALDGSAEETEEAGSEATSERAGGVEPAGLGDPGSLMPQSVHRPLRPCHPMADLALLSRLRPMLPK